MFHILPLFNIFSLNTTYLSTVSTALLQTWSWMKIRIICCSEYNILYHCFFPLRTDAHWSNISSQPPALFCRFMFNTDLEYWNVSLILKYLINFAWFDASFVWPFDAVVRSSYLCVCDAQVLIPVLLASIMMAHVWKRAIIGWMNSFKMLKLLYE